MKRLLCEGELDWRLDCETLLLALRMCVDRGVEVRMILRDRGPERDRAWFTVADLDLHRYAAFFSDESSWTGEEARADLVVTSRLGEGLSLRDPSGASTQLETRNPEALANAICSECRGAD